MGCSGEGTKGVGAKQHARPEAETRFQEAYMQLCNTTKSRCQLFSMEPGTQNECGSSFIVSKWAVARH